MKKNLANILTSCRILGSILLLFLPVFSKEFYSTYLLCGVSDMVDGSIARKTKSATPRGAKLDTVADLVFVLVSLVKILPAIHLPLWLWIWGGGIALIKTANIVFWCIATRQFLSLHTTLNKVTGLVLFLLPFALPFVEPKYSFIPVGLVATLSAVQELSYIVNKGLSRI